MDKKRSKLNVFVSIFFKIILLIGAILVKRFLIQYIGNEINGLNALYLSIIGFLSVAELGVGSSITFCMYKPIIENNEKKVAALYNLFKKLYLIIGIIILALGLMITPFLKFLVKDSANIDVNIYFGFFLMLTSVLLTYFFSAKISLINAYKNNYVTTTINSFGLIFQYVLQILLVVYTKSFYWFLISRIISVILQWIATELYCKRKYGKIISIKQVCDLETKQNVAKNVKAMFMHKIGGALVNSADSIIISIFLGVTILGSYSNYITIMTSMIAILTLFFTPLTSVLGHYCIENNVCKIKKHFNIFYIFNFSLGLVFFLGYYSVADSLISLLFSEGLEMDRMVVFIITINYFIQFMRKTTILFRDATGLFYYDRWKPIIEGIVNIVLSVIFVNCFGVVGVIVATIITNLLICHIVEPYVLYKHLFSERPGKFYLLNYSCIALFLLLLICLNYIMFSFENPLFEMLVNGLISIAISSVSLAIIVIFNKDFRLFLKKLYKKNQE